jgi:gas vesicle protein
MKSMTAWAMFTLGLAVGAAVALCYAPQTGVQTRRKLRRGFDDASDTVKDYGDKAARLYKRGRDQAEDFYEDAAPVMKRVMDQGRKAVNL